MTTQEKFDAAVNVIRSLPKNGAYQPSHELQLRFYAYYKQATEGPCQQSKPAFWEVVKKAKWDAWMRLGNMSRQEAMNNYVEELKKIVETMSYTDNVATFLGSLDAFYESVPAEDLELLVGPVIERIRSQPGSPLSGSPLGSRETSPQRVRNPSRHISSSLETSPASSHSASPLPPDTDGEDEEFKDTVEVVPERFVAKSAVQSNTKIPNNLTNGFKSDPEETKCSQERGRSREKKDNEFLDQIAVTMQNLQRDLDRITGRVRGLEGKALQALAPQHQQPSVYPKWWPLRDCSPRVFALMIMWPFLAQGLISLVQRYRQRKM